MKKLPQGCIYELRNLITGDGYVGQHNAPTATKRWARHVAESRKKNAKYPLHRAIAKYGWENFSKEIIWAGLLDALNTKEIHFIKKCRTFIGDGSGYNLTLGGGGMSGFKLSRTTKKKLRLAQLGRHHTEATKEKLSVGVRKFVEEHPEHRAFLRTVNLGRVPSKSTRRAISAANRGKSVSDTHRENLAIAQTGRIYTQEACTAISIALTGRSLSAEHKQNIADGLRRSKFDHAWTRGKRLTTRHKANISAGGLLRTQLVADKLTRAELRAQQSLDESIHLACGHAV